MRISIKARIGLFVSLGILAGIGFVGVPGLILGQPHTTLAPNTPKSNGSNSTSTTRTGSNSTMFFGNATTQSSGATITRITPGNMSKTQQIPAGDEPVGLGSLAALVSLVIAPATAVSLVGPMIVVRRSRRSSIRSPPDQD